MGVTPRILIRDETGSGLIFKALGSSRVSKEDFEDDNIDIIGYAEMKKGKHYGNTHLIKEFISEIEGEASYLHWKKDKIKELYPELDAF